MFYFSIIAFIAILESLVYLSVVRAAFSFIIQALLHHDDLLLHCPPDDLAG